MTAATFAILTGVSLFLIVVVCGIASLIVRSQRPSHLPRRPKGISL
jgi:hypothetical protein